MWIKRLRIVGYSSFKDSGWIELGRSFNVFVGQNNVGKSAVLRALLPPLPDVRHRDETEFRQQFLPMPTVEFDLIATPDEIREVVVRTGKRFNIPIRGNPADYNDIVAGLWASDSWTLEMIRRPGALAFSRKNLTFDSFPKPNQSLHYGVDNGKFVPMGLAANKEEVTADLIESKEANIIFYFGPQRLNIGKSPIAEGRRLDQTASNLPAVLFDIQGNSPPIFEKLKSFVRQVLPSVESISVVPRGTSECEIKIWARDTAEDPELGFPLDQSGTGVSQVLAIIAAAMTNKNSVIIIDEISSFLHPSAVKTLIRILVKEWPRHQYIISAHSSESFTAVEPDRLFLIVKRGYNSEIEGINSGDVLGLRKMSDSLGVSLSDVFGSERICWVEGETEEICFPLLIEGMPDGLRFAAIKSPDVVSGKNRKKQNLLALFKRVADAVSPLIRGMSFGVDRENLSDQAVKSLEVSGNGRVHVLPRKNLESYLINIEAISRVISEELGSEIGEAEVRTSVDRIIAEERYSTNYSGSILDATWLKTLDGAKLLSDIFLDTTGKKLEYRKTRHSRMLITSIIDIAPESLEELRKYVIGLMESALRDFGV